MEKILTACPYKYEDYLSYPHESEKSLLFKKKYTKRLIQQTGKIMGTFLLTRECSGNLILLFFPPL